MSVSIKGCKFKKTYQSIHFESFNDECAIVIEAQDADLLSQESKLTRVNLQLNWCPSKSKYKYNTAYTQLLLCT